MTKEVYTVIESFDNCPSCEIYTTKVEQTIAIQKAIAEHTENGYTLETIKPLAEDDSYGFAVLRKSIEIQIRWSKHLIYFKEEN